MEIIDLSLEVNEDTRVPSIDTGISDPPVKFESWVEIEHEGFKITKIEMGAHAGTHCDFPSHWVKEGKSSSNFPIETWVGWAIVLDFRGTGPITIERLLAYKKRIVKKSNVIPVLLNDFNDVLTEAARKELISWRPQAIVMGEGVNVNENMEDSSEFLRSEVPMVMNIDHEKAALVKDNDLIVAAPVKFSQLEASPVRVIAIRGLSEAREACHNGDSASNIAEKEETIALLERKIGQLTLQLESVKQKGEKN